MEKPAWLDTSKIKITLDARPLLASGQHPLQRVIEECTTLQNGEIYEIVTPFPPAPMIEKLAVLGFVNFIEETNDGMFHTYFVKQGTS